MLGVVKTGWDNEWVMEPLVFGDADGGGRRGLVCMGKGRSEVEVREEWWLGEGSA